MKKVGEVITKKVHFVIYHDESKEKAYRLYSKWYNQGWHKSLLTDSDNLYTCILFIEDYVQRNYQ